MNRCRPYRFVHPLRGCGDTRGDAHHYQAPVPVGTWWAGDLRPCRAFAPNGDEGRNNQHLGARHVSASSPPQCENDGHTDFTATPPRCDGATTTLHSPLSTLHTSHTFSAKERDSETGLSYFGSRYYSSDLSIWLSVDPQAAKYPSLSPYVYCADNPVKLVDPNGEETTDFYDIATGEHLQHIDDGIDEAIAVHRIAYDAFNEEGTLYENKDKIGYSLGKNSDFIDLAGTIYAESDAWNYSLEESAGIGSVIRNRAIADNASLIEVAKKGACGWSKRDDILSLYVNKEKVNIAYRAAMLTIGGNCDYSNGGYYWQGRDFAKLGSGANNEYYQNGFHFKSPSHDIFGMGDKISNDSWKYKYESTAAAGRTVFMRLTEAWKNANHTKKWNGGR